MKQVIIIFFIILINKSSFPISIFDTEYYEIQFNSINIENDKLSEIKKIKFKSINKIFKDILLEKDYANINKIINVDLINTFIKNIVFKDEKIVGNNYYSKIKINFDSNSIINFLRNNKLSFVIHRPKKFLIVILEDNKYNKNLFTNKNSYYDFLLDSNFKNNFYEVPNLDINDRYILTDKDIINKNLSKLNKFSLKYNNLDIIVVMSLKDKSEIKHNVYLFSNESIINLDTIYQKKIDYNNFFTNLEKLVLNNWKNENKIQNKEVNYINCNIEYFNLYELKAIKKNLKNSPIIKNFMVNLISYKKNNYDMYFFGNYKILSDILKLSGLKINFLNNNCNIKIL